MRSTRRANLMLAAGLAALALTAVPVGFDNASLTLDLAQAWAGNGKGNGHANGHADATGGQKAPHGSVASSMGALNGAHASDTALANASPNSRVGKIAAYRDAALAAQAAGQSVTDAENALADAQAALDAADTNHDGVLDDAEKAALTADAQAAVDAAIAAADTNPDGVLDSTETAAMTTEQATALADAEAALAAAQATADSLETAVTDAQQKLNDAQTAAEGTQEAAATALNDAANKPVTDQVIDAVNHLLGID